MTGSTPIPNSEYMIQGSSEPLRYLNYAQEQLEHAIRRAEDEGEEVPVLQGDKDLGSAPVERGKEVLPGMRTVPLERRECYDEMGGDFKMESAKELHIEALSEDELDRIVAKHGLFHTDHEAWAVIIEEIEKNAVEAIKELVQVVACARKWKKGHLKDWVEKKAVKV